MSYNLITLIFIKQIAIVQKSFSFLYFFLINLCISWQLLLKRFTSLCQRLSLRNCALLRRTIRTLTSYKSKIILHFAYWFANWSLLFVFFSKIPAWTLMKYLKSEFRLTLKLFFFILKNFIEASCLIGTFSEIAIIVLIVFAQSICTNTLMGWIWIWVLIAFCGLRYRILVIHFMWLTAILLVKIFFVLFSLLKCNFWSSICK